MRERAAGPLRPWTPFPAMVSSTQIWKLPLSEMGEGLQVCNSPQRCGEAHLPRRTNAGMNSETGVATRCGLFREGTGWKHGPDLGTFALDAHGLLTSLRQLQTFGTATQLTSPDHPEASSQGITSHRCISGQELECLATQVDQ